MDPSDSETPRTRKRRLSREEYLTSYERLRLRMKMDLSDAAKGAASTKMLENIDELTRLYGYVQRDRVKDTIVHLEDSTVFREASNFAAINARNMKFDDSLAIDEKDFLKKLRVFAATDRSVISRDSDDEEEDEDGFEINDEFTFNKTNWLKLGILYHHVSKKPVVSGFLNGPLETERKKQAPRTRIANDSKNNTLATAQQVDAEDIATNEEQNTAYMVKSVYQTYLNKDEGNGVNFFKLFINPKSFGQSVENLFYISFLIKDGKLKLYLDESGTPCVRRVSQNELAEATLDSSDLKSSHHIATFNYHAWKTYIENFKITEPFLGHRDEVEDQMPVEDMIDDSDDESGPTESSAPTPAASASTSNGVGVSVKNEY
ncbi:uncharacterized protein J8A68_001212 [[Candida] subhashii]|uniref:Non-structural maintenance of chromosomes element 4 n=1 Tax=[Candida] subhashii TaxID=561895 RepID=A0A8J5QR52_9ASCO|nr:uncharacterized protein J8A68_001212 [[Candida] subhashii]KAG7665156.1 hypothetical protein J8A68_001212 [[Candida] subhashii]